MPGTSPSPMRRAPRCGWRPRATAISRRSTLLRRNQSNTPVLDPATYALKELGPGVHDAVSFTYDDLLRAADIRVVRAIESPGTGARSSPRAVGRPRREASGISVTSAWPSRPAYRWGRSSSAPLRRRAIEVMPSASTTCVFAGPSRSRPPSSRKPSCDRDERRAPVPDHGFPARIIVPDGPASRVSSGWARSRLDRPLSCPWTSERYVLKGPVYQTALIRSAR